MSLAEKIWTPVSLHRVVLAWLRAERATNVAAILAAYPSQVWEPGISNLLDNANLNNPEENRARLRLLYHIRNMFVVEIPPDTEWFEVQNLTHDELGELHVVNYAEWNDAADKNELLKVGARKPIQLQAQPPNWETPILLGHTRNGPFTILEGNKRLTAYAGSGQTDLNIPVLVGLSPVRCLWHILDQCNPLMADLIQR